MKKKEIKKLAKEFTDNAEFSFESDEEVCVQFAESLLSKGVLVEAEKWTSAKDRFPDTKSLLLTLSGNIIIGEWFDGIWRSEGKNRWEESIKGGFELTSDFKTSDITHWMPLPAAPGESNTSPSANVIINSESTVSSAGNEVKTLQECKDDYARDVKGFKDWRDLFSASGKYYFERRIDEVNKIYYSQFKSSPASTVKVISDEEIEETAKEANKIKSLTGK